MGVVDTFGHGSVTPENPVTKIPEQDGYRVGKKSFLIVFLNNSKQSIWRKDNKIIDKDDNHIIMNICR